MSKKVTIIIPVYKGKQYMREAIDSALAQTYDNLEILVINDGSPDNGETDRIAKSYGDKIRYIYKENGGVSTVLNMALKEMTGEYFSWLSHDDVYYPQKIEDEINYLTENNLLDEKVILYSDYDIIDQDSILTTKSIKPHKETAEKHEYSLLRGHINGITLLIPKIAFDECGNFDEKLLCAQDYELWYRMMKAGYKFIHIPKILAKSRVHDKQVTHTNPKVETEGNKFWIDITDDISKERKIYLEGSEYSYYKEMEKFLRYTVYKQAADHCLDKVKELEKECENKASKSMVSVILPFTEVSDSLHQAINSVLEQTHKNIELVLVNNNSSSNLSSINELIKKNKNIKLQTLKENKGLLNAINNGIDNATGDYIAFMEPNTVFDSCKIETQVLQMIASNSKISHTSYNLEKNENKEYIANGKVIGNDYSSIITSLKIALPTVMLDRKYLTEKKLKFNEKLVEDTSFYLSIIIDEYLLGIDYPLTTIYNGQMYRNSNEQETIDIKNKIALVLNTKKLEDYNYELASLTNSYTKVISKFAKEKGEDISQYINQQTNNKINNSKVIRITKRVFASLKEGGVRSTYRKIKRKVKKVIKK